MLWRGRNTFKLLAHGLADERQVGEFEHELGRLLILLPRRHPEHTAMVDAGMGRHAVAVRLKAGRTAQERVTGGRWRRVVLGDVLAEQELELGGRARCLAVEVAGDVCGSGRTAGYVFRCGTPSTPVFVVCVASPVGRPTKDCWSDPKMAGAEPTLWGSGASRRRQSIPDDLHISQSCPGDSEHGSGRDLARSRGHGANRHGAVLWNGLRNTCLENARRAQ